MLHTNQTQDQHDLYSQDMMRQKQYFEQQQQMMMRQNNINYMVQMLNNVSPYELIKLVNRYVSYFTVPMNYQQKCVLLDILVKCFTDETVVENVEDWVELLRVLNVAESSTYNYTIYQAQNQPMGGCGYNPYGMMGGGFQQFGMFQQPQFGMQGFNNSPYGMVGMYPQQNFGQQMHPQQPQAGENKEEQNVEEIINRYKQMFMGKIYQVDPIIFISAFPDDTGDRMFVADKYGIEYNLRIVLSQSLYYLNNSVLQTIYTVLTCLYQSEYNKNLMRGQKENLYQGQAQHPMGPQMQMNSMGMNMGMGMGMGMMPPMNNFQPMGPQMQMNGMGMGMGMGMMPPMGGFQPMGPQMQMNGMGMGMGMMNPPVGGFQSGPASASQGASSIY